MKVLLLSAAALMAGTALATASDLPDRAAVVTPVMVNSTFSWTGLYVGVHGAWIRDNGDAVRTGPLGVPMPAIAYRASLGDDGLGGGGQIGYSIQFGNLVAGLEADFTVADVSRTHRSEDPVCACALWTELGSEMSWFGSARARAGIALPGLGGLFEQSLLYVTGGLAFAQIEHQGRITINPPGVALQAASDSVKMGFTIGGGVEVALTSNVSIKTETLYYDLEDESLVLQRAGSQASYRFENDGWISRIGLNVRF